jgi:hypothetical protein
VDSANVITKKDYHDWQIIVIIEYPFHCIKRFTLIHHYRIARCVCVVYLNCNISYQYFFAIYRKTFQFIKIAALKSTNVCFTRNK